MRTEKEHSGTDAQIARTRIRPRSPRTGFAYLYVIQMSRYCKIGWTVDIRGRLKSFGTYCPLPPAFVFYLLVPHERVMELERHTHQRLADKRTNGEWFRISPTAAREAIHASRQELGIRHYSFGSDRIFREAL